MEIQFHDFNGSDKFFNSGDPAARWAEVADGLGSVPVHLKGSGQKGKVGKPVFDVVGTNLAIKAALKSRGWKDNIPIPAHLKALGTDVDFAKQNIVTESQFGHYALFYNNIARSEVFFQARVAFDSAPTDALVVIAKSKLFDSANSSLTYEQAVNQASALAAHGGFSVPVRIVGLFEKRHPSSAVYSEYSDRTSRTVAVQVTRSCTFGGDDGKKYTFEFDD